MPSMSLSANVNAELLLLFSLLLSLLQYFCQDSSTYLNNRCTSFPVWEKKQSVWGFTASSPAWLPLGIAIVILCPPFLRAPLRSSFSDPTWNWKHVFKMNKGQNLPGEPLLEGLPEVCPDVGGQNCLVLFAKDSMQPIIRTCFKTVLLEVPYHLIIPANLISVVCWVCATAVLSALPPPLSGFGWQAPLRLHSCPTQTCPRSEHQIMVIRSIISRFVEALINFSPLEVFPQGKCCFFAIVCGHQPSVHTLPEFDAGLNLITLRQELIKFPYSKRRSTTHFLIFQFAQLGPRLQCHKVA